MDLTQDFKKAKTAYNSRLAYVTLHQRKEVWSAGHYFNIDPLDFQRSGFQQGKQLKSKPSSTKQKYCYVFGEDDALLQIRQGLSLPNQFNRPVMN